MLLASLNPSALTATDVADAVRIDGTVFSRSDLAGAATSVAERVGGRAASPSWPPRPPRRCWPSPGA